MIIVHCDGCEDQQPADNADDAPEGWYSFTLTPLSYYMRGHSDIIKRTICLDCYNAMRAMFSARRPSANGQPAELRSVK